MAGNFDRRFQVFVSSTFTDLQVERQKVLQAILEMKAFPSGMELFPAADDEQWEFIEGEIDSSDIYLLIVGGRYGSLGPSGKSYTEQEYDYALAKGKKIIAFLHQEPRKLAAELTEESEDGRAKLARFREALKGRLVQFYSNPDDLKAKVWQSVSQTMALKQSGGWVRAENSTRIEDLKKIADLQEQLADARREIEELKKHGDDPRRQLRQLNDSMPWKPVAHPEANLTIPGDCTLAIAFRDIFLASFPGASALSNTSSIKEGLDALMIAKLKEQCSSISWPARDWNLFDNTWDLVEVAQIQFQAIGLITSEYDRQAGTVWYLTTDGLLQLGLLRGVVK